MKESLAVLNERTLALLEAAWKSPLAMAEKSFTQALGLVHYDLEPVAKQLYPVITPLRNRIPRVRGEGGTATNWKAVTGINTALLSAGIAEGKRGGVVTTTEQDFVASYKGIGLEDNVNFEAEYAAENFDNIRALAVNNLLRAVFIAEENILLNAVSGSGLTLGITPTPVATLISDAGAGTLAEGATKVFCVALTPEGLSLAGGPIALALTGTAIAITLTRTNADATTDTYGGGSAQVSVGSNSVTTDATHHAITAHVAPVKGAAGYAWFCTGNTTTAAASKLHSITTINSVNITIGGAGTQVASAASADNSGNALEFDGIASLALGSTGLYRSNSTGTDGVGTGLTSDGAAGIVEIDADLQAFWDTRRLSPTEILVSAQEVVNINKKVIASGGTPLFRFMGDWKGAADGIMAGALVGSYLNKFGMGGGMAIPIRLHPGVPAGQIRYISDTIPYPLSNVRNILQVKTRREYYQVEWPLRTRKYEYGVYADELLQMYAPFAFGVRDNIANA